jgi:hypothetical protein
MEPAFEIYVDDERDLIRVALKGPVGVEEFLAGFEHLLSFAGYRPGVKVLVDMLEHVHQVDAVGIKQIAGAFLRNGEALRGSVVAVVVARAVSYGMLRMLQALVSDVPFTFSVHYDLEEAEEALDLP